MKIVNDGKVFFDVEYKKGKYRWREVDGDISVLKGKKLSEAEIKEVDAWCKAEFSKRYYADREVFIPDTDAESVEPKKLEMGDPIDEIHTILVDQIAIFRKQSGSGTKLSAQDAQSIKTLTEQACPPKHTPVSYTHLTLPTKRIV